MNVEANKALARRFYGEVWGRGNVRFAEGCSQTPMSGTIFARRKLRQVARAKR